MKLLLSLAALVGSVSIVMIDSAGRAFGYL